jgi:hypothetical protein
MRFSLNQLSVLAYANAFTLWHYKAAACGGVTDPGFFDAASGMLAAGDLMMVSAGDGARMLCVVPDGDGVRLSGLN